MELQLWYGIRLGTAVRARAATRFQLTAPVIFKWSGDLGEQTGAGFIRDIAAAGSYVWVSGKCPPLNSPVVLDVLIQSLPGSFLWIEAEGRVVRVEPEVGIAVCFTTMRMGSTTLEAIDLPGAE